MNTRHMSSGSRKASGAARRSQGKRISIMLTILLGFVVLCALTGGSSRWDVTALLLLRPLSVLCLAAMLIVPGRPLQLTPPIVLLLLWAGIMIMQVVPLPPQVWTQLPGRAEIAEMDTIAGLAPSWRSLSLTPDLTWNSLLTLLPPLVVVIGLGRIDPQQRSWLVPALVAIGMLSAALGTLQMSTDSDMLYFYRRRGATPMGLFANHNHQAAFLALMLPFLRVWTLLPIASLEAKRTRGIVALAIGSVMVVILVLTGSRAGFALGLLGLLATWLVCPRLGSPSRRGGQEIRFWKTTGLIVGPILLVGTMILLGKALSLDELLATQNLGDEQRFWLLPYVLNAVHTYFPFGSGFGSFDAVFRRFEPEANLSPSYFNHAHNDLVEIVLEGGAATLLILVVFLGWLFLRAWKIWGGNKKALDGELLMARAAFFGILILGLSSLVDYPLRTPLLASIFAMFCCMIEWPRKSLQ